MFDARAPQPRQVTVVLGEDAASVRELELSWTNAQEPTNEAALTSRWSFPKGTAPHKLHAELKLPKGTWDAELSASGEAGTPVRQRTVRLTLDNTSWFAGDHNQQSIVLLLDEHAP